MNLWGGIKDMKKKEKRYDMNIKDWGSCDSSESNLYLITALFHTIHLILHHIESLML